jgi:hypothetical protein
LQRKRAFLFHAGKSTYRFLFKPLNRIFFSPYRELDLLRLKERAAADGGALAGEWMEFFQNRQTIKLRKGESFGDSNGSRGFRRAVMEVANGTRHPIRARSGIVRKIFSRPPLPRSRPSPRTRANPGRSVSCAGMGLNSEFFPAPQRGRPVPLLEGKRAPGGGIPESALQSPGLFPCPSGACPESAPRAFGRNREFLPSTGRGPPCPDRAFSFRRRGSMRPRNPPPPSRPCRRPRI